MGRRSMAVVGTFGSVEEAKEVLSWGERLRSEVVALTEEGGRHEEELLAICGLLEEAVGAREAAERRAAEAAALAGTFEEEAGREREAQRALKEELRAARAEVAVLHSAKADLATENRDLEQRLDTVRSCLSDAPALERMAHLFDRSVQLPPAPQRPPRSSRRTLERSSAGQAELSDIYDKSENSLDVLEVSTLRNGRQWKRNSAHLHSSRSRSNQRQESGRKLRRSGSASEAKRKSSARLEPSAPPLAPGEDVGGLGPAAPSTPIVKRRSVSDTRLRTPGGRSIQAAAAYHKSMANLRSPRPEPSWLPSGCPIGDKAHTFIKATSLRPEACHYCEKRIHFGSKGYRCDECRYLAHLECREWVPRPCVPKAVAGTPAKGRLATVSLADSVPPIRPKIPALLVHCVTEMERRGLSELGLYRIPGSKLAVSQLVDSFVGGRLPDLSRVDDVHVIASAVKNFLGRLRDPLVPSLSLRDFTSALESEDAGLALDLAVQDLPVAHRDSLAFLAAHWQRVAANAAATRMPREQLAKVLAPTVCGERGPTSGTTMAEALEANGRQTAVLEALLDLPREYWDSQLMLGAAHPLLACPAPTPGAKAQHSHAHASPTFHLNSTLAGGASREHSGPFFSKPRV